MQEAISYASGYSCEVRGVKTLDAAERQAMVRLYLAHYAGSSEEIFLGDLADKDEILVLKSEGAIAGFTTLKTYADTWEGQRLRVLFSGDTIVAPQHWGQQALSFAWVRHLGALGRKFAGERFVWFLLAKGHRTYRYLSVFARNYYPGGAEDQSGLRDLTHHLATRAFARHFNPATGLVEFNPSRGHLRPEIAQPRPDELSRNGVNLFLQLNPGFHIGHELCCVCDISVRNMKPLTRRLFREGLNASGP